MKRYQPSYSPPTLCVGERTITCSADVAGALIPLIGAEEREHFVVLALSARSKVIEASVLSIGSHRACMVDPIIAMRWALTRKRPVTAIIVAHNHPSTDPTPSPEDVAVTRQIVEAGKLIDIECLDHLIVGAAGRWVSLKERGLGF